MARPSRRDVLRAGVIASAGGLTSLALPRARAAAEKPFRSMTLAKVAMWAGDQNCDTSDTPRHR